MALDDIGVGVGLAERHDPSRCEEPIEMFHSARVLLQVARPRRFVVPVEVRSNLDRKSTRLNSSHGYISYAVFCLKKKKKIMKNRHVEDSNTALSCHPMD